MNKENYDDVTDVDECKVEMSWYILKKWVKSDNSLLRAVGGQAGKEKHNIKLNLFGGISRKRL